MREKTQKSHMVDLLFPIALFFVFALCAVAVILLAARIYESITSSSSFNDTARTSLAYVSEKLHQNDVSDSVTMGEVEGCEALVMKHGDALEGYTTYIYVHENQLKELFIKDGVEVKASVGKPITEVESFDIEELSKDLFRFSCMDAEGQRVSTIVSLHSEQ